MKRTPVEVRAAVVSRYRRGGVTHAALAAEFGLSKFTVGRILKQARERAAPVHFECWECGTQQVSPTGVMCCERCDYVTTPKQHAKNLPPA